MTAREPLFLIGWRPQAAGVVARDLLANVGCVFLLLQYGVNSIIASHLTKYPTSQPTSISLPRLEIRTYPAGCCCCRAHIQIHKKSRHTNRTRQTAVHDCEWLRKPIIEFHGGQLLPTSAKAEQRVDRKMKKKILTKKRKKKHLTGPGAGHC